MAGKTTQPKPVKIDVIIIGAGHSGLAMSHYLTEHSIEHVLLERGEVAHSWRTERWDSFRLLTPNWLSQLPGYRYGGGNPDGYMNTDEVVDFIQGYAGFCRAPVVSQTNVESVERENDGYRVSAHGKNGKTKWLCRCLVIATGAFNTPVVPKLSAAVPDEIHQLTAQDYRNAAQLEEGGVLLVGAAATGLQLADELQRSGRPVTLAVGEHVRMPRLYRDRDIQWWLLAAGILDERIDQVDDIQRVRRLPSPQLVGSDARTTLDLNALSNNGVRLVGRLAGISDRHAQFSGSLSNVCALADLKMERMLSAFDEWAARNEPGLLSAKRPEHEPTRVDASSPLGLDLMSGEIRTIVWATGFRPDYAWLNVPVFNRKGQLHHEGGVVAESPGMYVLGQPFLRRRKSSFIHGAADDARELAEHLVSYLDIAARPYLPGRRRIQAAVAGM